MHNLNTEEDARLQEDFQNCSASTGFIHCPSESQNSCQFQ